MVGVVGALLICFVWLGFLRRLDIFEPERWRYSLIATLFGALSVGVLSLVLSIPAVSDWQPNGDQWHDLVYFIVRVGGLEDLAKFIPLLIMVRMTREVNEPYDFLKYAMCSAWQIILASSEDMDGGLFVEIILN